MKADRSCRQHMLPFGKRSEAVIEQGVSLSFFLSFFFFLLRVTVRYLKLTGCVLSCRRRRSISCGANPVHHELKLKVSVTHFELRSYCVWARRYEISRSCFIEELKEEKKRLATHIERRYCARNGCKRSGREAGYRPPQDLQAYGRAPHASQLIES